MLKEWIVTLHNKEDLDDFYEEMENPGGSFFIPDRSVEIAVRRPISRNTHYMLTEAEAKKLRDDPRVWDVADKEWIVNNVTIRPAGWTITNGQFDRAWDNPGDPDDINWGLLRHTNKQNLLSGNWGLGGTNIVNSDLTITASGKNVDVVIFDGHVDPGHPEFAINPDGTGGSRVIQYNWFQNDIGFGTGNYAYTPYVVTTPSATYPDNNLNGIPDITEDNDHGCHVAGTVAGNTQGWARDANIYNINIYGTNPNFGTLGFSTTTYWDYVRAWHNSKPINPATGRRNPTISNHSYGSALTFTNCTRIIYRGVDFNKGSDLTWDELAARGVYVPQTGNSAASNFVVPYYFTAIQADIYDAMDDGILVIAAAGNDSFKIVDENDQDYNNFIFYNGGGAGIYTNRGTGSAAGLSRVITVGSLDNNNTEYKSAFSQTGSRVDIFAAGENIISSLQTMPGVYGSIDPRDNNYYLGEYQGTSMASPQVCGVGALLLEHFPNMTQEELHSWFANTPVVNEMSDTGTNNVLDVQSLQGAPNKLLYWENIRPETGTTFPMKKFKARPTSGRTYPRPKIRRKG